MKHIRIKKREKQKKYPSGQIKKKVNVKEALDSDVLDALKALGYA